MSESDGRGEAVDAFHRRFFDFIQELADIGGDGLDIAPVSFGVDGIEGQRGFAGAAHADDGGYFSFRDIDIDIFQVIGFDAFYNNVFLHVFTPVHGGH